MSEVYGHPLSDKGREILRKALELLKEQGIEDEEMIDALLRVIDSGNAIIIQIADMQ